MQSSIFKIGGLYDANNFSEMPPGALLDAENIDIPVLGIAQPRRGFDRHDAGYADTTHRTDKAWFYQGKLFAHVGATIGSATNVQYLDSSTWNTVGSFSAPTGYRLRWAESSQNLYFATSTGVKVIDAYDATPRAAGVPKAIHFTLALDSTGSNLWLATGSSVGYRVAWNLTDANGNLITGAPSQFVTIENASGGDRKVSVRIYIPAGITTSYFYQVYRSIATTGEPSDEVQLVYEGFPSSSDITAGYVDITDITPDELRGAALYTNASQQGLAYSNEAIPLAKDIAVFKGYTFYANLTSKHRFYLTLLGVGSGGLVDGNTITIAGQTYTAKATPAAANDFELITAGSASQNIRNTAISLITKINENASSTVYAYYISSVEDTPGKILIEERSVGGSAFTLSSSNNAALSPDLTNSGTSKNDRSKNGVAISKEGQPEHVPLSQYIYVGSEDEEIKRIIALKDSLFCFKGDGVYRVYGSGVGSFASTLLDPSAVIIGPETPAVLNNTIFLLTIQGVAQVSETGVTIKSFGKIETELLEALYSNQTNIESLSFGVAYESDRKYYLFFPSSASATYPDKAFVFNSFTNSYFEYLLNATCGISHNNNLYLGHAASNYVWKERKNLNYLDYADFGFEASIDSIDGTTLTISTGLESLEYGDVIYQSDTVFARVLSIDTVAQTFEIDIDIGLSVAACTVLKGIATKITWNVIAADAPANQKLFHTAIFHFKEDFNGLGYLDAKSDLSQYVESVPIEGHGSNPWGLSGWGMTTWGGEPRRGPIRQWLPRNKMRCNTLEISFRHKFGFSGWSLLGLTLEGSVGSTKGVR